jgi:hypothetical protein
MPTITGSVEDREQIRELYARYAIYLDSSKFSGQLSRRTAQGQRRLAVRASPCVCGQVSLRLHFFGSSAQLRRSGAPV